MRARTTVLVSLVTTLGVPGVVNAAPRHDRGLTLGNVPSHIASGEPVLLYGRLRDASPGDRVIRLYHRIGAHDAYTLVGATRTDTSGLYEFPRADGVVLTNRSWFVRGPEGTHSRPVRERVDALVSLAADASEADTLHALHFSGHVVPGHAGEPVLIQARSGTGDDWHTLRRGRLDGGSEFRVSLRWRVPGALDVRAVFPGDERNTRGTSDAVSVTVQQAQRPGFTITSSVPVLTVGDATTISGALDQPGTTTPAPGVPVTLVAHTAGTPGDRAVASANTGTDGSYAFTQAPTRNTWYFVRTGTRPHRRTAVLFEGVREAVTVRATTTTARPGDTLTFSGTVLPGRADATVVDLQRLGADGDWHTVTVAHTDAAANYTVATLAGSAPSESLRVRAVGDTLNRGGVSPTVTVGVVNLSAATLPPAR